MTLIITIFWISLSVLFFCYIGYGIILYLLNILLVSFKRPPEQKEPNTAMPVTLIVASYNEETVLEKKLRNTLEIDYPADKLHIIFITDGSTDNSVAIIKKYPPITLLHDPGRKGKLSAIKRAMLQVKTPVVIFSDANTMLNKDCIQKIVQHYQHPGTGGVAGEKKIIIGNQPSAIGAAEGLYWKYESFLKKQDAAFNTVVGAAGELFSIRTSFVTVLPLSSTVTRSPRIVTVIDVPGDWPEIHVPGPQDAAPKRLNPLSSFRGAASPEAGSTCLRTPSSRPHPTRPGAARVFSMLRASWSASAR